MAGSTTAGTARRSGRGSRLSLGVLALVMVAAGVWVGVGFLTLTSSRDSRSFPVAGSRLVVDAEVNLVRLSPGRPAAPGPPPGCDPG